jgi:hypothetical protein
MEAREQMPRLVFGVVPSFQEAKDATAELKDALDEYNFEQNLLLFAFLINNCQCYYSDL